MKMVDDALDHQTPQRPVPQRLESSLPLEIPEFREIVVQFVEAVPDTLHQMQNAWQQRDFRELRELAHKLKGTGGTVGFAEFTAPAARLQDLAESETPTGIPELLAELELLSSSLYVAPEGMPV